MYDFNVTDLPGCVCILAYVFTSAFVCVISCATCQQWLFCFCFIFLMLSQNKFDINIH